MDPTKSSVKRNLFGPVDHDAVQRDLEKELRDIVREDTERMKAKYDFDPETNKPIEGGKYEWEPYTSTSRHNQESQAPTVDTEMTDNNFTDNSANQLPPHTPQKSDKKYHN